MAEAALAQTESKSKTTRRNTRFSDLGNDPLWYKDAVIYEAHVRAFHDSNGDGIGDFRGLTEKLDYLQELGITAIWLLPFYPSPLKDDGYDIADYNSINPIYGTLKDFKVFLQEAHRRHLRVITELVVNHTSDQHPWFQRSRRAKPGTAWRDFYVWSETPDKYRDARIIFRDFEPSNWTWDPVAKAYFWHRFYSHQPDLNYDNPQVAREIMRALDFWLDMGVDGLRLDAVPYLYERGEHFVRESQRDARLSENFAPACRRKIWRPNAAGRGQSMAGGRGQLFRLRQRRRMPHGISFSFNAATLHGGAHGRPRADC